MKPEMMKEESLRPQKMTHETTAPRKMGELTTSVSKKYEPQDRARLSYTLVIISSEKN